MPRLEQRYATALALCLALAAGCSATDSDAPDPGPSSGGAAGLAGAVGSGGDAAAAGSGGTASGGQAGAASGGSAATGAAGSGGVSSGGSGGTGGLPACNDPGPEPNETDTTAHRLPSIDDCDDSGSSVSGVSAGARDTDYFVFSGRDDSVRCRVNPAAQIDTGGLRLCMFANCPADATTVTCTIGSFAASDSGYHGCCSDVGGVELDVKCGQTSLNADDSEVYIRVDQVPTDVCAGYSVTYHY